MESQKSDENSRMKEIVTLVPDIDETNKQHRPCRFSPKNPSCEFTPLPNIAITPAYTTAESPKMFQDRKPQIQLDSIDGVKKQLAYYFSEENLQKDKYLKSKMDSKGYINADIIAAFPRMKNNGIDKSIILKICQNFDRIDVVDDFLRPAKFWYKFVQPPLTELPEDDNAKPDQMGEEEYQSCLKADNVENDDDLSSLEETIRQLAITHKSHPDPTPSPMPARPFTLLKSPYSNGASQPISPAYSYQNVFQSPYYDQMTIDPSAYSYNPSTYDPPVYPAYGSYRGQQKMYRGYGGNYKISRGRRGRGRGRGRRGGVSRRMNVERSLDEKTSYENDADKARSVE